MKFALSLLLFICFISINAQEIINLEYDNAENINWEGSEKDYYSEIWGNQVVTNVSVPTMEVFRPEPGSETGTAVVIAPGGGLYALSIKSEGKEVGAWLAKRGVTAFVLKYRLVPTGEDGVAEISALSQNDPPKIYTEVKKVIPFSISDGLNAIDYVRQHSESFRVQKDKIGFMGFSAGGAVTMGVMYNCEEKNRPDFIVPVYPWTPVMPVQKAPINAPPMLVICASNDPLMLASGSVELYESWLNKGYKAGLHMYSKGGHGFGMKKQDLPSDKWIEQFYDWSIAEGIVTPIK